MFSSNVAPRRKVRAVRKEDWTCSCKKKNPYFWNKCPDCGATRPN